METLSSVEILVLLDYHALKSLGPNPDRTGKRLEGRAHPRATIRRQHQGDGVMRSERVAISLGSKRQPPPRVATAFCLVIANSSRAFMRHAPCRETFQLPA